MEVDVHGERQLRFPMTRAGLLDCLTVKDPRIGRRDDVVTQALGKPLGTTGS